MNTVAILGSTGSIGSNLLNIFSKDKKNIKIVLLTANKNYKKLLENAKKYNVKNLIINDIKGYQILKNQTKNLNINVFNNFNCLNKIFKKKIDYTMSSIVGIHGLEPTLKIIKFTKTIAIANKESIICGWNLLSEALAKNSTQFLPVDSEHFSIWYGLKNIDPKKLDQIYLTASGGSLQKISVSKIKKMTLKKILKHPNWSMGKKITVDSATMINKLFEIIEARNIFNIKYEKIKIIIHPSSYVHAILKFNNGMIKLVAHDTTMKIPIFNTFYNNTDNAINTKKIDFNSLNSLNFSKVNLKKYPSINLLKLLPKKFSLFDTIIVSANDFLVELFLKRIISFTMINKYLVYILNLKELQKYKKIKPKNVNDIYKLNNYVRFKLKKNVYKA